MRADDWTFLQTYSAYHLAATAAFIRGMLEK
jgi:hypothetical protein